MFQKNILPPLNASKSPLKFFKRFRRTNLKKQSTKIFTVNTLQRNENDQQDSNQQQHIGDSGGIVNNGFTGPAETQQTQLTTFSNSIAHTETGEDKITIPDIVDCIPEEPVEINSIDSNSPSEFENKAEIEDKGIDNKGFDKEENMNPVSENVSVSLEDSGIEQDSSSC